MKYSDPAPEMSERIEVFFSMAMSPILEALSQRMLELAAANRLLRRSVRRGMNTEADLKKRGKRSVKLLKESLQLQESLRQLAHRTLLAQEDERWKISHELQDEIAQILLGINVRLLALRLKGGGQTTEIENDIASAQQLVLKSAASVRRIAHKFTLPHDD
jgi:signal transduction histidine kinase